MIPQLSKEISLDPLYLSYFKTLAAEGAFAGEIEYSYAARLSAATDNSVYQLLPAGILFPKTPADIQAALRLAARKEFRGIRFAPRGGGTGTNGGSLTSGVIIDVSRHLKGIGAVDPEKRTVHAEAGVIKDWLNEQIKQYGLFFSPNLSTSNRATLGGMISNDASGQGSLKYGKTSQHILDTDVVLMDGSLVTFGPVSGDELKAKMDLATMEGQIYRTVYEIAVGKRDEIVKAFPDLTRFLTGYDLKHVWDPETGVLDISRIICGAEGTLGFITGVTLDLTPVPSFRALVNIKYDSFDSALRHAPELVNAGVLSVETIDSCVFAMAKKDIVWYQVKDLLTEVPGKTMDGINIVEFAGTDAALEKVRMDLLINTLNEELREGNSRGIIGYQTCTELKDIQAVYAMRKKAVGLLGNADGAEKPVAFVEDTVVPPEHLADFIKEFRELLDSHHLRYGMFGHVDSGVLHVRPALDLCDPEQEVMLRTISDKVAELTAKYGGIMWGEHGRGYRSEYGPKYYGGLFDELRRVKGVFDPDNRINPGKICAPYGNDSASLVSVDAVKRGFYDRQIPPGVRQSYNRVVSCNGNGACFSYDTTSPMCPTYKFMGDRIQSPKGRAGLMREWLRELEEAGANPLLEEKLTEARGVTLGDLARKTWHTVTKRGYDFSDEVLEAMNVCLACKACASQCPIKVDVPDFRARFFNLYYSRYLRPAGDLLVRHFEESAPLMARLPALFNKVNSLSPAKFMVKKILGFVDVPVLSSPVLKELLREKAPERFDLNALEKLSPAERAKRVLIVQDTFTTVYDAPVVHDLVSLVAKTGKIPVLLPLKPNGKALHIRGYLREFAVTAAKTSDFYNRVFRLGIPMVGVDPAIVLCYRDEYRKTLGAARGDFVIQLTQEWLLDNLSLLTPRVKDENPYYLLAHCTQKSLKPGTHDDWVKIFRQVSLKLIPVPVGCCGMAGLYGHTAANEARSQAIYRQNWAPVFQKYPLNRCLVTGFSCREQVKRMEHAEVRHPLQVLNEIL